MKRKMFVRKAVLISLFSALISVSAFLSVPVMAVPITMQSFAVFLALFILGPRAGTVSVFLYVFIGAVGMPVFSGFSGGIGRLFDIGGGFIFGFCILSLVYLALTSVIGMSIKAKIISAIFGQIALYATGVMWYVIGFNGDVITALVALVLPFLLFDAVKLLLAFLISFRLGKILEHLQRGR